MASWVPDLASPSTYAGAPSNILHYRATGDTTIISHLSSDPRTLTLEGRRLDKITALGCVSNCVFDRQPLISGDINDINENRQDGLRQAIEWLKECRDIARDRRGEPMSYDRAGQFWRTLIGDMDLNLLQRPADNFGSVVLEYFDRTIVLPEINRTDDPEWYSMYTKLANLVDRSISSFAIGRRFSLTNCGRLGLMPADAKEGDVIWVFYGGNLPYVVRRCEDGMYTFIGDCYLHGFMHGEAIDLDLESVKFVLV
jgi:hypothetical protein